MVLGNWAHEVQPISWRKRQTRFVWFVLVYTICFCVVRGCPFAVIARRGRIFARERRVKTAHPLSVLLLNAA